MFGFLFFVVLGIILALIIKTKTNLNGTVYQHYGLLNKERIDPTVEYTLSMRSLIIMFFTMGSIFIPIYFIGFNLYVPNRIK
jgi:hypothetical protein